MSYCFNHFNFNVLDLDRSVQFYEEALGLHEVRRSEYPDCTYLFLGDGETFFTLELSYFKTRTKPYDLGERNFHHLAMTTRDYSGSFQKHKQMGCVVAGSAETPEYMISDPDGYLIEILPQK